MAPPWASRELREAKRLYESEPIGFADIAKRLGTSRSAEAIKTKAKVLGWRRQPAVLSALMSEVGKRKKKRAPMKYRRWSEIPPGVAARIKALWTGDNDETSQTVADQVGVPRWLVLRICAREGWKRHPQAISRSMARRRWAGTEASRLARKVEVPRPVEWPPHRFEDDPGEAERSRRATPIKMTPSGFLGSAVGCSAAMAAVG